MSSPDHADGAKLTQNELPLAIEPERHTEDVRFSDYLRRVDEPEASGFVMLSFEPHHSGGFYRVRFTHRRANSEPHLARRTDGR